MHLLFPTIVTVFAQLQIYFMLLQLSISQLWLLPFWLYFSFATFSILLLLFVAVAILFHTLVTLISHYVTLFQCNNLFVFLRWPRELNVLQIEKTLQIKGVVDCDLSLF